MRRGYRFPLRFSVFDGGMIRIRYIMEWERGFRSVGLGGSNSSCPLHIFDDLVPGRASSGQRMTGNIEARSGASASVSDDLAQGLHQPAEI